jgi:tetratricopeptide (TPR) repeat protein
MLGKKLSDWKLILLAGFLILLTNSNVFGSPSVIEKAKSLLKEKKYQTVVDLLNKENEKTPDMFYLKGLALFYLGKLDAAYESNSKAIEHGHLDATFNSICIASLSKNLDVAYHWWAYLWTQVRNNPKLLKKYSLLIEKDEDLKYLRQSETYRDVFALFTGKYKRTLIPKEQAGFSNGEFKVEQSPYWEGKIWTGVVINVPSKIKVSAKKILLPIRAYSTVSSELGRFNDQRDVVVTDAKNGKIYRGFYGPKPVEEIEAPPPFYVPKLKDPSTSGQFSGGRQDFDIDLDLPKTPGFYEVWIESRLFQSNSVRFEVVKN